MVSKTVQPKMIKVCKQWKSLKSKSATHLHRNHSEGSIGTWKKSDVILTKIMARHRPFMRKAIKKFWRLRDIEISETEEASESFVSFLPLMKMFWNLSKSHLKRFLLFWPRFVSTMEEMTQKIWYSIMVCRVELIEISMIAEISDVKILVINMP